MIRAPPSMPTKQAVALLPDGPPSALRARVLAALATHRMLLGEFAEALPVAERAVAEARQAGAVAEQAHGLTTLGTVLAQRGELDAGMAALRTAFGLARRAGNAEDIDPRRGQPHVRPLHGGPVHRGSRGGGSAGRQAARSLRRRRPLTSILDNNTAAVLTATGRWAEADRLLAELVGESPPKPSPGTCSSCSSNWPSARVTSSVRRRWPTALGKAPQDPAADRPAARLPRRAGAERR